MDKSTCKYHNGTMNERCDAGVAYASVTPEPWNIEGIAFRRPCIDWAAWNEARGQDFSTPLQAENFARRGCCAQREIPTDAEIAADKERRDKRTREVLDSLAKGIVPPGVIVCRSTEPPEYLDYDDPEAETDPEDSADACNWCPDCGLPREVCESQSHGSIED